MAFAIAAVVFVAARAVPFAGARVGLGFDSFDYINLARSHSVIGLLGASRPPTYLFVLKLLGTGRLRLVTWVQFAVASVAWIALAAVAARELRNPWARGAGVAIVFLIGSCLDVVQWDRLVGTESLSLSLGALLVVAACRVHERVTTARVVGFAVIALLWAMLRDANAIVVGIVGVGLALWVLVRRSRVRGPMLILGAACVVIAALSTVSSDAGVRWQQPIQNVVTFRVLSSPERRAYFLDHGLPLTSQQADRIAGRCVNPPGVLLCVKVTDPEFYAWMRHHARGVYFASWFEFPATTVWEPLTHAHQMIGERYPVASITATNLHAGFARAVEAIVFPRSSWVLGGWILLDGAALVIVARRRGRVAAATVPLVLVLLTYPHLWAVWSGDGVEMVRHGLAASVQLRLGLWLLTVALLDAFREAGAGAGYTAASLRQNLHG